MYDCQTLMKLLYPYLDGVLDVKESLRVQTHLQECPYCLEIFRQEEEFLVSLRASDSLPEVPAYLRDRICKALKPQTLKASSSIVSISRSIFSPVLVTVTAMIVLSLIGIILYALPKQAEKQNLELVEAAVENHVGIIKGKIPFDIMSSEPTVILKRLEQGVGFPVLVPQLEGSSMRLVGGRLIRLRDEKKAAFLTFESKEGKVSLLMTSPQLFQGIEGRIIPFKNINFYMTHYHGYYALAWTIPQLSYVLVSDEKARITEACRICHENTRRQDISGFDDRI